MKAIKTRKQILKEAKRMRAEIRQIFIDAEHWNNSVRKPHEAEIDPDPDGQLQGLAKSLDTMIFTEECQVLPPPATANPQ